MAIQDFVSSFTKEVVSSLEENVVSVLLYGSTVDGFGYDIDLLIVLRNKVDVVSDVNILKEIREQHADKKIDLQLLYAEELEQVNQFSLDAHGCFIIPVLQKAVTLFGVNPFLQMDPDSTAIAGDVLQKIQYYLFRARQAAYGCGVLHKDTNPDLHRKKIKKIMQDLLLADGINVTSSQLEDQWFALYPSLLSNKNREVFNLGRPLDILEALPIYEELYQFALNTIPHKWFSKQKPILSRFNDIVFEFLPANHQTNQFVILCEGLPCIPNRGVLMAQLSREGWNVIYPRYRGTWESLGTFLEISPADDIQQICKAFSVGIEIRNQTYLAKNISLLGSSFGGGVALCLADHPLISSLVALSPVVDFSSNPATFDSLKRYPSEMYSGAYRFSKDSWQSLIEGRLLIPQDHLSSKSLKKITVFAGELDPEIKTDDLRTFCERVNVPLIVYPEQSHLSFSKVSGRIFKDILAHL